jgi:hypothetical protein
MSWPLGTLVSVVDFEPKKSWVQAPNMPEKKNKKSKFYQAIRNQNQIFHGLNPKSATETSGLNFPRDFERPKLRVLQKTYEITHEVSVERKPEKFSKFRAKKNYCVSVSVSVSHKNSQIRKLRTDQ